MLLIECLCGSLPKGWADAEGGGEKRARGGHRVLCVDPVGAGQRSSPSLLRAGPAVLGGLSSSPAERGGAPRSARLRPAASLLPTAARRPNPLSLSSAQLLPHTASRRPPPFEPAHAVLYDSVHVDQPHLEGLLLSPWLHRSTSPSEPLHLLITYHCSYHSIHPHRLPHPPSLPVTGLTGS